MSTPAETALERYCNQAWNTHQLRHGSNAAAAALAPTPWLAGEQGRILTSDDAAVLEGLVNESEVQVLRGQLQLARILITLADGVGDVSHEFGLWVGPAAPVRTWRDAYAPQLAEHPLINFDLTQSVAAVFRRAGLSPGETEVMRLSLGGMSERSITRATGQARRTVRTLHGRAEEKLSDLTLPPVEGANTDVPSSLRRLSRRAAALSPGPRPRLQADASPC